MLVFNSILLILGFDDEKAFCDVQNKKVVELYAIFALSGVLTI